MVGDVEVTLFKIGLGGFHLHLGNRPRSSDTPTSLSTATSSGPVDHALHGLHMAPEYTTALNTKPLCWIAPEHDGTPLIVGKTAFFLFDNAVLEFDAITPPLPDDACISADGRVTMYVDIGGAASSPLSFTPGNVRIRYEIFHLKHEAMFRLSIIDRHEYSATATVNVTAYAKSQIQGKMPRQD